MAARWGLIQDDTDGVGTWVCDRMGSAWQEGAGAAIGLTFDGHLVAGITYTSYNGASCEMSFAMRDHRVLNRATLWAAFWYPFGQMGAKRVTAFVDCTHARSLRFVEQLGFVREGTMRQAASDGGDRAIFRMLKQECRWLRDNRYRGRPAAAA